MTKQPFYKSLYVQVLVAIAIGIALGHWYPETAVAMKPFGDGFVKLIKMAIAPIIFCTVVTGIAGMQSMKSVGKTGGMALLYFEVVSTVALIIGLVVVNVVQPGAGMHVDPNTLDTSKIAAYAAAGEQITASLAQLEAINARQTLTVSTEPSFAATWLVPRLGQFSASHPQVEVRVEATALLADLRRERIDVAIRHGLGDYPGLDVQALMAPPLIPVASPRLLAEGPEIREAIDCLAYPLLQESERNDWRLWLRAMGVEDDPRSERGPAFADDLLLVRAAEAGQGIALVREIHARAEIASGRLAVALERPWPSRFAYYAVSLPGAAQRAPLSLFLAWLREQAAAEA